MRLSFMSSLIYGVTTLIVTLPVAAPWGSITILYVPVRFGVNPTVVADPTPQV